MFRTADEHVARKHVAAPPGARNPRRAGRGRSEGGAFAPRSRPHQCADVQRAGSWPGCCASMSRATPQRILEIGAGDGTFMLAVARRLAKALAGSRADAARPHRPRFHGSARRFRQARLAPRDGHRRCLRMDGAAPARQRFDAVTANLFLHHFDDAASGRFACWIAAARAAAAGHRAAPRQFSAGRHAGCCGRSAPMASRCMMRPPAYAPALHGTELSALWPAGAGKPIEERRGGPFTHVFAAARQS